MTEGQPPVVLRTLARHVLGRLPVDDLMLNILASFAQFERALIAERVRAGMARARKQGKPLGRPRVLNGEFEAIRDDVLAGRLSQRVAAKRLGVSQATVWRRVAGTASMRGLPA